MRSITQEKFDQILAFLQQHQIDVLMIADFEDSENVNLQYLSGQPNDGIVLIKSDGESILIPWDLSLAEKHAEVDEIIDYSNYDYNMTLAVKHLVEERWKKSSLTVGLHGSTQYGYAIKIKSLIPSIKFYDAPIEIDRFLEELRATKSESELNLLIEAARIGSKTIKDIRTFAESAGNQTEKDLSFLVRKKMAEYGADDIAFESLVANSSRSHEIHCHPFATNQEFAKPGLALIDFGAKYQGYNSDITVPISFGELNDDQLKAIKTTLKAYESAIEMIDIGVPLWKIHECAEEILKDAGYGMPYSLGHGLGLTVHDAPFISRKPTDEYSLKYWKEHVIEDGMIFTIEPSAFKQGIGGFRLENDVMIRNGKVEIITDSEYIKI